MANFLTSSIGKKFIQSVSGAFLIIFLLLHGTINFFSVLDSFHGKFGKVAADNMPYTHGDGWFQLGCDFMSSPFIKLMVPVLALGFVIRIVVLGFLCFHLTHFWAKMQLQEFMGNEAENPYALLLVTFGNIWVVVLYVVWFIAIWLHLNHGFWSMFQTIGWNNKKWLPRLRVLGVILSTLIVGLFLCTAVNAYVEAHYVTASAQYTAPLLASF